LKAGVSSPGGIAGVLASSIHSQWPATRRSSRRPSVRVRKLRAITSPFSSVHRLYPFSTGTRPPPACGCSWSIHEILRFEGRANVTTRELRAARGAARRRPEHLFSTDIVVDPVEDARLWRARTREMPTRRPTRSARACESARMSRSRCAARMCDRRASDGASSMSSGQPPKLAGLEHLTQGCPAPSGTSTNTSKWSHDVVGSRWIRRTRLDPGRSKPRRRSARIWDPLSGPVPRRARRRRTESTARSQGVEQLRDRLPGLASTGVWDRRRRSAQDFATSRS